MSRHRRTKQFSDVEIGCFVDAISSFHSGLVPFFCAVDPRSHDYQIVLKLSDDLRMAVEQLTGKTAPWCAATPGAMPGRPITTSSDSTVSWRSGEVDLGGGAWHQGDQEMSDGS